MIGLQTLARLRSAAGDLEAAASMRDEVIAIERKLGDIVNETVSKIALANVILERGEVDVATQLFREGTVLGARLRSWWLAGGGVEGLAAALLARGGDPAEAIRLVGASEALFAASGLAERYRATLLLTGPEAREPIIEARGRSARFRRIRPGVGRRWALAPNAAVALAVLVSESATAKEPVGVAVAP